MTNYKYEFRPNLFQKKRSLELVGDTIQITNQKGRQRLVDLKNVKRICVYGAGTGFDAEMGNVSIYHCILKMSRGRSITIHSASYVGPGPGKKLSVNNHLEEYYQFVDALKNRLVAKSPDIPVVYGHRFASICWMLIFIMGLGLLGLFLYGVVTQPGKIWEIWPMLFSLIVIAVVVLPMAYKLSIAYSPETTTLKESISK